MTIAKYSEIAAKLAKTIVGSAHHRHEETMMSLTLETEKQRYMIRPE